MKKITTIFFSLLGILLISSCEDEQVEINSGVSADFTVRIENITEPTPIYMSGTFGSGPAMPGDSYEVEFFAAPGQLLSFLTMYVQSNDIFIATPEEGLALFDGEGNPVEGNIAAQLSLFDAGTEENQEPGEGEFQAPRQPEAGAGEDEDATVQSIDEVNDGFTYPAAEEVISAVLEANDNNRFTLTIENVSGSLSLPSPISPGAFAVHTNDVQLFTIGETASEGVENIAEDGTAATLGETLEDLTSLVTPFSPGVYVVHEVGAMPLFEANEPVLNNGLEDIAEDGSPMMLNDALSDNTGVSAYGTFTSPVEMSGDGPIGPGDAYEFTFSADREDQFNLATMFIQSNDLFLAFEDDGLPLFTINGLPLSGDITNQLRLWDAGTEVNMFPGAGPDQAPRQSGPDTGEAENGTVRVVDDPYEYPAIEDIIRITITPSED